MKRCKQYALVFAVDDSQNIDAVPAILSPEGLQARIIKAEALMNMIFDKEIKAGLFRVFIDDDYADAACGAVEDAND